MRPTDAHTPHRHHSPEEMHNEGVAHEHTDVDIRSLSVFAAGLAVITGMVFALMYGLFWFFDRHAIANERPVSPLAAPSAQMPPSTTGDPSFGTAPGPRLLTNEYRVLDQHRRNEEQQLNGYGWTDQNAGIARMPVAEAKKLILERGLPARTADPVDPALGTALPARGEATSGRAASGVPRGAGLPDVGAAPAAPPAKPAEQRGGH